MFSTGQTKASDNSEDKGEDSTAGEEDEGGWDSDESGPNYLEPASDGCSPMTEREVTDSAPMRNDTYSLAEHKRPESDHEPDQEVTDCETESSLSENEESAEELEEENGVSQTKLVHKSCTDTQKQTHQNSKTAICNATFVGDNSRASTSPSPGGLSNVYKKPVSVVQPILSSVVKSSVKNRSSSDEDCLANKQSDGDTNQSIELVKAVLCYRNKIALALADITHQKQPRFQSCSEEITCGTGGETFSASKPDEKSCFRFSDKIVESKVKDRNDLKATVIKRSSVEWKDKRSQALHSEKHHPMSLNEDSPRPFVRRPSVKINPAPLECKTKFPPKSLKLENCNLYLDANSPPMKRRSTTLCKLNRETVKRDGKGANLEGCLEDSLNTSPGFKSLGALHSHRTTPSVQCTVSPARSSRSPKTVRRRSSQVLRVNEDEFSSYPESTVENKGACLEHHRDSLRNRQALKVTLPAKRRECCEKFKLLPTAQLSSRGSSKIGPAEADVSKNSVICTTKIACESSREDRVAKSSYSSQPTLAMQQKFVVLLEGSEYAIEKVEACREKRESCPAVVKNRRDHELSCSKNHVDAVTENSVAISAMKKAYEEKRECNPADEYRGDGALSCAKGDVDFLMLKSGSTPAASQKTSADNRSCKIKDQRSNEKNNIVDEVSNDAVLNCRRRAAEVSSRLGICVNKEGLTFDRAVQLLCKQDLESKEKVAKTANSSARSARNSVILTGRRGSDSPPVGSNVRKRPARESVAMDTPDSLPRKQPKRGSPLSCPENGSSSFFGSQFLNWQERESTMKGNDVRRLRIEKFSPQNMKLLSPIRRPVVKNCDSMRGTLMSPCKGPGFCDKTFCFECS